MTLRGQAADKQNRSFLIHPLSPTKFPLAADGSRENRRGSEADVSLLEEGM